MKVRDNKNQPSDYQLVTKLFQPFLTGLALLKNQHKIELFS
jgi:hypothetical protein